MLFDLQGKRRRVVQGTYLTLAILMAGGLVFFGIGGEVQGGLADIFSGGGGSDVDSAIEERVERTEEQLARRPNDPRLLAELMRDRYQLAFARTPDDQVGFSEEARGDLRAAARAWERYRELEGVTPEATLATIALQIYDVGALNRPKRAQDAATIIAESENTTLAYLRLAQYATLAGDTRTADLAGDKAVELAPSDEREDVRRELEEITSPPAAAGGQAGGG